MSDKFDVIIIGAGPGGYVAAIRCAQLGLKTAIVEKRKTLGGTCLNIGCIPSKALLYASEKFEEAEHHMGDIGVKVNPKLDLKAMMQHKDDVVSDNTKGIEFLMKKNKIKSITGTAEIVAAGSVKVGKMTYEADSIIIATGSDVISLPGIKIDEKKIVSSTGALELSSVPKKMVVIGGGVIGLELGTVWRRLGAQVTVVEFMDNILPGMDNEIRKEAKKLFAKQGIEFKLSSKVTGAKTSAKGVDLTVEPAAGGKAEKISADIVLMAIGRKPYVDGLGLDNVGVKLNERGQIETDEFFETSVEGIYAVGDVIAGPMLAHKAEDEGVVLAEMLAGQSGHIDYDAIPGVVYTWPEIASVGKTEEQLKEAGVKYKSGKFPFMANGRARAMNATDGFVKILADAATDRVLGAHMIGPNVGELISEVVTVMEFEGTAEDIGRTCHAHPTLTEVVKEAALAVHKRQLHM
ncbi:MAG: dihydrolipoyl dehydrogenase [Alphaproteobacteria bacterium]|nr:MAG: dihydrolipoyl dehydrogenase [Alphaproteobacteria bacterium]